MAGPLQTQKISAQATESSSGSGNLLAPEVEMLVLTWATFFILLWILKKFAFKPILQTLDEREKTIRTAVEEAAKTHEEYQRISDKRKQVLTEADNQAKEIINQSREIALKNAKMIQDRTREEADIIMENAHREIEAEQEKAAVYLREKSVDAAVALASRILRENIDPEKHKKINDNLIDEI